ncbi:MAG: hypothetical protein A3F42_00790 [Gammaproteobacteria bacterium RIFCSPHIGHO2_12_FULL_37_34]|nr:MAG: hypothetical protein A3F42_00790 [Gammaproteobacteria bacterium RIFCSPHIGHO2_12_FULL_37_34]
MKSYFITIICFLMGSSVFAANEAHKDFLLVKLDFNYSIPHPKKGYQVNHLKNVTSMRIKDSGWKIIGRSELRANGDVLVLLGQLEQMNTEGAKMKFLVIDLTRQSDLALETSMILHIGRLQEVTIKKEGRQMKLSVMVI